MFCACRFVSLNRYFCVLHFFLVYEHSRAFIIHPKALFAIRQVVTLAGLQQKNALNICSSTVFFFREKKTKTNQCTLDMPNKHTHTYKQCVIIIIATVDRVHIKSHCKQLN